ncbi:MAG: hypothetical protein AMJ65_01255 [Phycisphaerae bacterium SG8_4]|nr:MAG: hypothetical protein AMJ65_01255 [Phycisphaerae bacterium SG8_4]
MNTRKLLFYMLAALLGGCVPVISLHPLYTKEDVVFDKKLLGTWVDDPNEPETTWQFKSIDKPENAYKLIFTDEDGLKGSFVAHLVKLQDKLFLDVYPSDLPWEPQDPNEVEWPHNIYFLIPAHAFMRIDSAGPRLKMRLMLESQLKELLEEDPDAIERVVIEDRLILTASTKKLQAFVLKYADSDKVFTGEIVLERKD